jgi:hypothetical protein
MGPRFQTPGVYQSSKGGLLTDLCIYSLRKYQLGGPDKVRQELDGEIKEEPSETMSSIFCCDHYTTLGTSAPLFYGKRLS